MSEERMELMETENTEIMDANYDADLEESGGGVLGKVAIGLGIAVVAAGAAVVANKDKIKAKLTERKIAKLEKQGYIVTIPDDGVERVEVETVDADVVDVGTEE